MLRSPTPSVSPALRLEHWRRELRFAVRSLRRSPGFAVGVILTLALGLGANAVVFSLLDDIFFRPPAAVSHPETLRRLWREQHGARGEVYIDRRIAHHEYVAVSAAVADRASLALYGTRTDLRLDRDDVAPIAAAYTTANYFDVLGVHPQRGRTFTEDEASISNARQLVVISDAFWRTHFGASPSAVGQTLTLDDRAYEIIGIAPRGFRGVDLSDVDVWLPLGTFPTRETARVSFWESSVIPFNVFARVQAGSIDALDARATTAFRYAPVTDIAPDSSANLHFEPIIAARGLGKRPQELSVVLRLSIVAALILLITIANVVNLLLGRAVSRRQNSAIRFALGAGRAELARAALIETMLLALIAGIGALIAANFSSSILRAAVLPDARISASALRLPVAALVVLLAVVSGAIAGLIPAMQASNPNLGIALRATGATGDTRRRRVASALVIVQTALSVALLTGAALLVQSARNVRSVNVGFAMDRIGMLSVQLPAGQRADTTGFATTMRATGDRVRAMPGIEAVAYASDTPVHGMAGRVTLFTATDSSESPGQENPTAMFVSSTYFATMGTKVIRGDVFADSPATSASAVVINEAVAHMLWRDRDPLGQCVYIRRRDAGCFIVSAVVANAVRENVLEPTAPQIYLPIFASSRGQRPPTFMIVRAAPSMLSTATARTARLLHDAFPRGTPHVELLSDRLANDYRPWRLASTLFGLFGALALVVAVLGTYSAVSYTVTERWRELGVRTALGAASSDVVRHVLRWGIDPVVGGAVVGVALAMASTRFLSSLLYGIDAHDPIVAIGVVGLVVVAATIASLVPAWRATRVDPSSVMLAE